MTKQKVRQHLPPPTSSTYQTTMKTNHRHVLLFLILSISSCLLLNFIDQHYVVTALATHAIHHHNLKSPYSSSSPSALHQTNTPTTDWTQYSLRQSYKKAGGILYKQSLLSPTEFHAVQLAITNQLATSLKLSDEKESSFATNRMGAVIERDSDVYTIFGCADGSLCRLVNSLVEGEEEDLGRMILSPDIPIEVS